MKKTNILLLIVAAAFMLGACSTQDSDKTTAKASAVDVPARFAGKLPCADCAGIKYELSLFPDNAYVLETTYLGTPDQFTHHFEIGQWVIDAETNQLTLDPGNDNKTSLWQVADAKTLKGLNADGSAPESGLDYTLERTGKPVSRPLTNTHWRLVRLDGEQIEIKSKKASAPYILLNADKQRVTGTDGCNRLMGNYTLDDDNLRLSNLAGTLMACPKPIMQTAQNFKQVLGSIRSYRVLANYLAVYNDQHERIAAFRATAMQ